MFIDFERYRVIVQQRSSMCKQKHSTHPARFLCFQISRTRNCDRGPPKHDFWTCPRITRKWSMNCSSQPTVTKWQRFDPPIKIDEHRCTIVQNHSKSMKIVVLAFKIVFFFFSKHWWKSLYRRSKSCFFPKIDENRCTVVQNRSKSMKFVVLSFKIVQDRWAYAESHVV